MSTKPTLSERAIIELGRLHEKTGWQSTADLLHELAPRPGQANLKEDPFVTDYVMRNYVGSHCTLCGNSGVIDSRGVLSPIGRRVGRANFCVCPNGQAHRDIGGNSGATPEGLLEFAQKGRGIKPRGEP